MRKRYETVIYDLDGTLLNTLEDLANAVNHALRESGYPERTLEEVCRFVGNGVGQLIREAVFKGRSTREKLKCGICGEHGGEPSSVEFCHYAGLNYVSCSPFRVPIARLAAAHAALNEK